MDEKGTKAGAATAVEMNITGGLPMDPPEVYLDRPFVYMIMDCKRQPSQLNSKSNVPFFVGTVVDIGE